MKKIYILITIVTLFVIAVNLYYFYDLYNHQVSFHKDILSRQTQNCGWEIEKLGYEFENEVNFLIFAENIANFFEKGYDIKQGTKRLELFYTKYQNLIDNINIYDNNKKVFSFYKDVDHIFGNDHYTSRKQKKLFERETLTRENDKFEYYLPIFEDNKVKVNISFSMKYDVFIINKFKNYHIENTKWQWFIDKDGKILVNNINDKKAKISKIPKFITKVIDGDEDFIQHTVTTDSIEYDVFSFIYPVRFLNHDFGVIFSLRINTVLNSIITNSFIIGISTFLILIIVIFIFLQLIRKKSSEEKKLKESENTLKKIIEFLPIGIMVTDANNRLQRLNKTAVEMFGIKNEKALLGRNISDQFLLSKNYFNNETFEYTTDSHQFTYYDEEDNEVIIYKKEMPILLESKDFTLEAFIDVTPLEKARKFELIANNAKSEFLAKMSHEIRTPLNGILGMADTLSEQDMSAEQKDSIEIIKKSAEFLLTIISDLLDFSKIEAGKLILEEIPYSLKRELEICAALFTPKAREKGTKINIDIGSDVPESLIGDPFRLRQVISNLTSNAVKFTAKGEIRISVSLLKKKGQNIILKFEVKDTGIGIPKEKLNAVFGSYSQMEISTSRQYGGTGLGTAISKQLVELMKGEIWVDSPSSISSDPNNPGSCFSFTIQTFTNEKIKKDIKTNLIKKYKHINALILGDAENKNDSLYREIKNFGLKADHRILEKDTINAIKNYMKINTSGYHIIFIHDTQNFDGFAIARDFHKQHLTEKFILVIISSNDKKGNFVKSKTLGVDHYLIRPYESSELFNLIQHNFPNISVERNLQLELNKIKPNLSILVAEDNPINQKVVQTIFKNLGHEIDIAQDGAEAIEKAKEKSYDIIFMDIMMPEKDGFEASLEIKELNSKLPIVAMSASTEKKDKMKAIESKMDEYITKPVKVNEIKKILIRWFSESIN